MDKRQVNTHQNMTSEFWFLFLHVICLYFSWTYGDPSAGPSAKLPRPAFLLPREQVQNSSFRGVNVFMIFLEVLPRSHGELPRKLFVGVAWTYVVCICWWAGHGGTMFLVVLAGESGAHIKFKVIHSDFELHRWQIHVTFFDG